MVAAIEPPKMMMIGMFGDEHVQIAAHEHHRRDDNDAGRKPGAGHNIHGKLQRVRERPAVLAVAQPPPSHATRTLRAGH